jgi:hypothetical protein
MRLAAVAPVVLMATLLACSRAPVERRRAAAATPAPVPTAAPAYVPGLGEIMAFQQMRHTKLWLAGEARNWPLAGYELDELKEGFAEAARLHPTQKDVPVPIDQAIESIVKEPLERVADAITKKDPKAFAEAYDTLTDGCNACHQASNHGFNVVQRPAANPFPNQSFAPPR